MSRYIYKRRRRRKPPRPLEEVFSPSRVANVREANALILRDNYFGWCIETAKGNRNAMLQCIRSYIMRALPFYADRLFRAWRACKLTKSLVDDTKLALEFMHTYMKEYDPELAKDIKNVLDELDKVTITCSFLGEEEGAYDKMRELVLKYRSRGEIYD